MQASDVCLLGRRFALPGGNRCISPLPDVDFLEIN
jgi:hypothetical protein